MKIINSIEDFVDHYFLKDTGLKDYTFEITSFKKNENNSFSVAFQYKTPKSLEFTNSHTLKVSDYLEFEFEFDKWLQVFVTNQMMNELHPALINYQKHILKSIPMDEGLDIISKAEITRIQLFSVNYYRTTEVMQLAYDNPNNEKLVCEIIKKPNSSSNWQVLHGVYKDLIIFKETPRSENDDVLNETYDLFVFMLKPKRA